MPTKYSLGSALTVALIVGLSLVLSSFIVARAVVRVKTNQETIHVIGSAREPIRSDFIIWTGNVNETAKTSDAAYVKLQTDIAKVQAYLEKQGVSSTEILTDAVQITTLYAKTKNSVADMQDYGQNNGTNAAFYQPIVGYTLSEEIEVHSSQIDLVDNISRKATELISAGVPFTSNPPMYIYTKLGQLKTTMQAAAAHDARDRAEQIAQSSGATLGPLRSANMNTPYITPLYSNADTDNGVDDTTSLNKQITAIVSADYAVK